MTRGLLLISASFAASLWMSAAFGQNAAQQAEPVSTAPEDVLTAKQGDKQPLRKADMEMLLPLLEENAKAYLENRLEPYRLDIWLAKQIKFDADTTDPLLEALNSTIKKNAKSNIMLLRVINDLITPLDHQGTWAPSSETAKKVVEVIMPVRAQQKYLDLPKSDPRSLERLKMPKVEETKGASADVLLKKTADVQRERDKKMKTEWPVIANNEQLWELDRRLFALRLLIGSDDEDKALVKEISTAAAKKSALFSKYLGLLVLAVNDGRVKDARIKTLFTPFKEVYDGASKRQSVVDDISRKLRNDAKMTDGNAVNRLIDALSNPDSKLTDDQRKILLTAKLDEAAARKSLSEYPISTGGNELFSYLVVFKPEADSAFKQERFDYRHNFSQPMSALAAKCGEVINVPPR